MIVTQIIYNLSLLIALSVISDLINHYLKSKKTLGKVVQGFVYGGVAVIAMMNPFELSPGLIFDGRSVILSLCALFFGPITGLIAGVLASIYRLYIGGVGQNIGLLVIFSSVFIGTIFHVRKKYKLGSTPSFLFFLWFGLIVHVAMLSIYIILPADLRIKVFNTIALTVIVFYPLVTVLVGAIIENQLFKDFLLSKIGNQNIFLNTTLSAVEEGVVTVDVAKNIIHLNKIAESIFGISEQEAYGKPINAIFGMTNIVDFQIDKLLAHSFSKLMPITLDHEVGFVSVNNKSYNVIVRVSPIVDAAGSLLGAVICFSDASLQNSLKSSLSQAEELFGTVFKSSVNSIVVFDTEGFVVKVNSRFCQLLGYSQSEIIDGKIKLKDLIFEDDFEESKSNFESLISGKESVISVERRFITKNKVIVWTLVNSTMVFDDQKRPFLVVSHIVDISKIKQTEIELKIRNEELVLAKERAEKSDQLKTAFLTNMSHEIRTPMNGILGVADLIVNPQISQEEKLGFVKILQHSCARLLNTINDILDVSKIDIHQIEIIESEFSIAVLFDHLSQQFESRFLGKNIAFNVIVENSVDVTKTLVSDYMKIFQILSNLLNNSLKFTDYGSVKLTCGFVDGRYCFTVSDTGVGVSEEFKPYVFENFSQEDVSINRGYEGTGVGLSIAKGFATALNGEILFKSEKNVGSEFCFSVPLKEVKHELFSTPQIVDSENKLTFLVAEKEDISYLLVEKILIKSFNADVIRMVDGDDVLSFFALNKKLDLVLMDVEVLLENGFQCIEKIRAVNAHLPIIVATAFFFPDEKMRLLNHGCTDVVIKPYSSQELVQKIRQYIAR